MRRLATLVYSLGLFLLAAGVAEAQTCRSSATQLCLGANRFGVEVSWKEANGTSGSGQAVGLTADSGYFWFFSSTNLELMIKVLDGRALNQHFWVLYGALSDVQYVITVTDTVSGQIRTYRNPQGTLRSVADTDAFGPFPASLSSSEPAVTTTPAQSGVVGGNTQAGPSSASGKADGCTSSPAALCLNQSRFEVTASWRDFQGHSGLGTAVPLTSDTGYFWFFAPTNIEVVIKILDGRPVNGDFWVFYGALSTVDYTITVHDTESGATKTYHNSVRKSRQCRRRFGLDRLAGRSCRERSHSKRAGAGACFGCRQRGSQSTACAGELKPGCRDPPTANLPGSSCCGSTGRLPRARSFKRETDQRQRLARCGGFPGLLARSCGVGEQSPGIGSRCAQGNGERERRIHNLLQRIPCCLPGDRESLRGFGVRAGGRLVDRAGLCGAMGLPGSGEHRPASEGGL